MSDACIELTGVSKRFGTVLAVDGVNLRVETGACFGLIGPNGAGKTTTFSLMCGYLKPTGGTVRVLGKNPRAAKGLRGRIGVLPQDAKLPASLPVGDLMTQWARLGGAASPETAAHEALTRVGMEGSWTSAAGTLSHGMAKRVGLAQALLGAPELMLLDEPTAGLDPKLAAQVRALIAELRGKATVVVSSHNLQELEQLCDAVAVLDHGRLSQAGTMAEFTGQEAEFHVEIAQGSVPLQDVRGVAGVLGAELSPTGRLTVRFRGGTRKPEEVISETLGLLLQRGVLVLGVQRGHRLEDKVLQLTA